MFLKHLIPLHRTTIQIYILSYKNQRNIEKKRRNIAPVLRQMNIGDVEVFDVEQATSVRVTISRLQIEKRREKVMFATKVVGNTIQVTRK